MPQLTNKSYSICINVMTVMEFQREAGEIQLIFTSHWTYWKDFFDIFYDHLREGLRSRKLQRIIVCLFLGLWLNQGVHFHHKTKWIFFILITFFEKLKFYRCQFFEKLIFWKINDFSKIWLNIKCPLGFKTINPPLIYWLAQKWEK